MENSWKVKTSPVTGFMHFSIEDDGEVCAKFRINPGDVKLLQRCQNVADYLHELSNKVAEDATQADVMCINDELENKFCYLLGYDAREGLFGNIPALSIMPDGLMFALHIMEGINQHVIPELRKRRAAQADGVKKYTEKYRE